MTYKDIADALEKCLQRGEPEYQLARIQGLIMLLKRAQGSPEES